jgi:hypothetical protein
MTCKSGLTIHGRSHTDPWVAPIIELCLLAHVPDWLNDAYPRRGKKVVV